MRSISKVVLGALTLAEALVFGACSSDSTNVGAAGGAGSGGSAVAGGAGAAGAGPSGSSGSAGAANGGGGTGGAGGSSGQGTTQAGSGGVSGSASSGGAGGSSSAGAAGTSGSSGQGGGTARPEVELDGAGWTMKCTKPDTQPGAGDRCWLLPAGQDQCPQGGYTSVDRTLHFGGTPGVTYRVTIRFQGTHEAGDYTGGTAEPKQFLRGATHVNGGLHTWLSLEVSAPAAVYNPNSGAGGGSVQVYDYTATISIEGGATIRLKAFDSDCLMHRYCQNGDIDDCKGLVVPGISPAEMPIDGGFLQMTVQSVVPS